MQYDLKHVLIGQLLEQNALLISQVKELQDKLNADQSTEQS